MAEFTGDSVMCRVTLIYPPFYLLLVPEHPNCVTEHWASLGPPPTSSSSLLLVLSRSVNSSLSSL